MFSSILASITTSSAPQSASRAPIRSPPTYTGPCATCDSPCTTHPQFPATLAKHIDLDSPLAGSVKPYAIHVLVRVGTWSRWPEHIDKVPGALVTELVVALDTEKQKLPGRVLVTAYEDASVNSLHTSSSSSSMHSDVVDQVDTKPISSTTTQPDPIDTVQLVILPHRITFTQFNIKHIPAFVSWLKSTTISPILSPSNHITSLQSVPKDLGDTANVDLWPHLTTVLVCAHKKRDKRCGIAGPMIMTEFNKYITAKSMTVSDIGVYGVSHIGGHKFAGNVIVYRRDPDGHEVADWFGRVKTCHVGPLVESNVAKGEVHDDVWRGRVDEWMDWKSESK